MSSTMTSTQINNAVRRASRPQIKVLLEFMGVSSRDQPGKMPEMKTMLSALACSDPETFNIYYNVIVNKKLPEGNQAVDMGETQRKILGALAEHMRILEDNFNKVTQERVDELVKKASADVRKEAVAEIEKAKKLFVTHQVKIGNKKPKPIGGVVPKQFEKLIGLAQQRKNILMVGPSGCGKTHVAGMIGEALDMDYSAQSCSAGVSESIFTGWLLPRNSSKFEYVESEFVRIYENGGVFLLDEFDNSDANLGVFLNMAIAQDHFFLPQRFGNTKVKKHKDFICVAAANTFGHGANGMYAGRVKLDGATLDRFKLGTVEMDYDENVENHVVENSQVLLWGRTLRQIIDKHRLQKVLSTRVMVDAADMINHQDWALADVNKAFFADWAREEIAMVRDDLAANSDAILMEAV